MTKWLARDVIGNPTRTPGSPLPLARTPAPPNSDLPNLRPRPRVSFERGNRVTGRIRANTSHWPRWAQGAPSRPLINTEGSATFGGVPRRVWSGRFPPPEPAARRGHSLSRALQEDES